MTTWLQSHDRVLSARRHLFFLCVLSCSLQLPVDPVSAQVAGAEFALTRELRIDGHEANLVPSNLLWVSQGGIVAFPQPMENSIRFFDTSGRALASVGRAGDGPGEFRALSAGGWIGDTLWIYDGRQSRLTFIGPDRRVLRTSRHTLTARPQQGAAGQWPEFGVVVPRALHTDGSLDAILLQPSGPAAAAWDRRYSSIFRLSAEGRILWLIGRVPESGHEDYFYYPTLPDGSVRGRPLPFVQPPSLEWAPDGSRVAHVRTGAQRGNEAMIDVVMMNRRGDTVYARSYPVPGTPLPRSVADSAIAANVAALGPAGPIWERHARSRLPRFHPPFEDGSVVDRDGSLWLALRTTGAVRRYLVLDPDGAVRGTVSVPRNVQVRAVSEGRIWAVERDEYDVPSIVRYRLTTR